MGINILAYKLAQKFTLDTASKLGAVEGASCQIASIVTLADGVSHKVAFKWVGEDGKTNTSAMIIKDGEPGATGPQGDRGLTGDVGPMGPTVATGAT